MILVLQSVLHLVKCHIHLICSFKNKMAYKTIIIVLWFLVVTDCTTVQREECT